MFCSKYGFGYSQDLSGDDIYQTGDFSFASFIGINLHQDKSGDDFYQSGLFSQGAAMFGIAAIVDFNGNDSYKATCMAQGFGSTYGTGAIPDFAGADVYYLGGKYFHEPLMPLDYLTLGQGMGFGLRPDMAGGLGVLGDCYKMQVYALAKYINRTEEIIPQSIIVKPPSAELRPGQKDIDSLPEYAVLDKILYQYIEGRQGPNEIKALGFDGALVDRVIKMVNVNEYKRNQFCPIIRISPKAFGVGRRVPIVGKYLS